MEADLQRRRELELALWRTSPTERPDSDSVENIVNKMQDAAILLDLLRRFRSDFERSHAILEIGGGQGWASCLVKRMFPHAHVTATDLSEDAVASVHKWERIFGVPLDDAKACPADEMAAPADSMDLVFCFSAAHHFVRQRRTLREMHRVLRRGGRGLYLHEPACPNYIHGAAVRRVNRKRPEIPEDVLRYRDMIAVAREVGLECDVEFYPTVAHRRGPEALYYSLISRFPGLQRMLPCTANFVFTKS